MLVIIKFCMHFEVYNEMFDNGLYEYYGFIYSIFARVLGNILQCILMCPFNTLAYSWSMPGEMDIQFSY